MKLKIIKSLQKMQEKKKRIRNIFEKKYVKNLD
jgi:hypothetical protein